MIDRPTLTGIACVTASAAATTSLSLGRASLVPVFDSSSTGCGGAEISVELLAADDGGTDRICNPSSSFAPASVFLSSNV
jgi:hypothetical protein